MTGRLAGKVAVVTGAASGIGAACATAMAAEGASVLIADLDSTAAEDRALAIRDAGGIAAASTFDASGGDSEFAALFGQAVDTFRSEERRVGKEWRHGGRAVDGAW